MCFTIVMSELSLFLIYLTTGKGLFVGYYVFICNIQELNFGTT